MRGRHRLPYDRLGTERLVGHPLPFGGIRVLRHPSHSQARPPVGLDDSCRGLQTATDLGGNERLLFGATWTGSENLGAERSAPGTKLDTVTYS